MLRNLLNSFVDLFSQSYPDFLIVAIKDIHSTRCLYGNGSGQELRNSVLVDICVLQIILNSIKMWA